MIEKTSMQHLPWNTTYQHVVLLCCHSSSHRPCLCGLQNLKGSWIYAVVAGHVALVLLCLRFSPVPRQKQIWDKVMATVPVQLNLGPWQTTIRVPRADDVKLLVCCLAWPPSCYVSDATDKNGALVVADLHVEKQPLSAGCSSHPSILVWLTMFAGLLPKLGKGWSSSES